MSLYGDNPTTACAHHPVRVGGIVECAICERQIDRKPCKACNGRAVTGPTDALEWCEECDGTGDGEWEVVQ